MPRTRRIRAAALGVVALLLTACSAGSGSAGDSTAGSGSASPGSTASPGFSATIPQPAVSSARLAPDSRRVDLALPTFSNPTTITNPLFPVSRQESVVLAGEVDGQPFRTEVTLLPGTRIIEWQGRSVPTLVSQYVAFLGGRLHEVAYDLYAQADDGSVWYFGEDVFNFADGAIVDTHGSWIAGRDGPAAMIMPGQPKVGDVYRPENIPGLVFEEVTVKAVGRTLEGPLGPVPGGLVIEEFHLADNATEEKTFGPEYGEFYTSDGHDVEALALAVPTDRLDPGVPADLAAVSDGALRAFAAVRSGDWATASAAARRTTASWARYRTGAVPTMIGRRVDRALSALAGAIDRRRAAPAGQAAIEAARWSLDLQLRYRPVVEVDLARFDLWCAQLLLDAAARNEANVNGDLFAIDYIRDRVGPAIEPVDLARLNEQLEVLNTAVRDADLAAVSDTARRLQDTITSIRPRT